MTTIDTLRSLQKRIREATGPDRGLDEAIARAFGFRIAATTRGPHIMREGSVASWKLPRYTTDPDGLGACVALQRAVLPGWRRRVREDEQFLVELCEPRAGWEQAEYDTHAIENHAHLLAIIAAMIAVIAEEEARERVG